MLDVALQRLPGTPPGSFSVVDARDIARAMILVNERGRRGERYLAAGRHMTMADFLSLVAAATGVKAPGRPVLLSWAMARIIATEDDRSRYDPAKGERDLGLRFRPVAETLRDEVAWFRANGLIPK